MHKLLLWLLSFYNTRQTHTRSSGSEPLTDRDRQDLLSVRESPGFDIVMRLAEEECESFTTELINANAANEAEILARFRQTKAAWQFFMRLKKRIEFETNEVVKYTSQSYGQPDLEDPAVLGRLVDPLSINLGA